MISDYQFERMQFLIDNHELTFEELHMVDVFIADPSMDVRLNWLTEYLRKRPYRKAAQ